MTNTLLLILTIILAAQLAAAVYFVVTVSNLLSKHLTHLERFHTALEARVKEISEAVSGLHDTERRS